MRAGIRVASAFQASRSKSDGGSPISHPLAT
jgi:hypothetical protein